jgi:SAM-dependent methyltransferase
MQPGRDKIEQLYLSGDYLRKNPTVHTEDSAWKAEILSPFLDCFARACSASPLKILDVGGGAGLVLRFVGEHLTKSCGRTAIKSSLEYSPDMLALQKTNNLDLAAASQGSIERTSFRDKEFDLVLLIDVLEHLPDDVRAIKEVGRISHYALIKIPLEDNVHFRIMNTLQRGKLRRHAFESVGHVNSYGVGTYRKLIQNAGGRLVLEKYANIFGYFLTNQIYRSQMNRWQYWRNWMSSKTSRLAPRMTARLVRDHVVMLVHFLR